MKKLLLALMGFFVFSSAQATVIFNAYQYSNTGQSDAGIKYRMRNGTVGTAGHSTSPGTFLVQVAIHDNQGGATWDPPATAYPCVEVWFYSIVGGVETKGQALNPSGGYTTVTNTLSGASYGTNYTATVVMNPTPNTVMAEWQVDGVTVHSQAIPPGGSATYTIASLDGQRPTWGYDINTPMVTEGNGEIISTNIWTTVGQGDAGILTNTWTQAPVTNSVSPPTVLGTGNLTNGIINFSSPDTTAARESTLRSGVQLAHADSQAEQTLLGAILAKSSTNGTSITVTNTGGGGSVSNNVTVNVTNTVLVGVTNQPNLNGSVTNSSSAQGFIDGFMGGAGSGLGTAVSAFTNAFSSPDVGGSGGFPTYSIPLGSFALSGPLIPSTLQIVFTLSYQILKWLLIAAFVTMVVKDSFEVIKVMGSSTQLEMPKIEIAGFNIGAVAVPALIAATLVVFLIAAVFLAGMLTYLTGSWASDFVAGPFAVSGSAAVTDGLSLLKAAFPLQVFFTLTVSYMAFRAGMVFVGGAVVTAIRFMVS